MEKNYRIHTNVNDDSVLNVDLKQDFDFLEVLSLKIGQEDLYKLDQSNYGVVVGRILANDAFGIPNAKISIFLPITEEDKQRPEIFNIYNYSSVRDVNNDNIRYNILPDFKDDECYRTVGTFPNKRLVLDDNSVIEVFDKYYKYTTVSNNAGDYMLFGVPTGSTMIHVDIDLSDIGILSQKPRDFYYKGYTETLFDNPNQFKESTNLNNLTQIISQDRGSFVYPFFASEEEKSAAITRCDINVQYKFEPTCVFLGSIVTDSYSHSLGHTCEPHLWMGRNSDLITSQGTIEMIRKTPDDFTEEFQIQGNKLIDGDGVWCYQIPMNLDFVGTDEYGNIIPTDNPNKGIPTRTRVRFRVSLESTSDDGFSKHRAKYLVPNNPLIDFDKDEPTLLENPNDYDTHYNFGSSTSDGDYRDLFWNNVYTVKNYIPRLQNDSSHSTRKYTGIKSVNYSNNLNPFPYNKARIRLLFGYKVLCLLMTVVISIIWAINEIIAILDEFCIKFKVLSFKFEYCPFNFSCITFANGLGEDEEDSIVYAPGCEHKRAKANTNCPTNGKKSCYIVSNMETLKDKIEQALSQEYETIGLDFYNDWVNGVLYFPLWYWKKTKKIKYFFGIFGGHRARNVYCECDREFSRTRLLNTCGVPKTNKDTSEGHWNQHIKARLTVWGIIKNVINKDGLNLYYYSPGIINSKDLSEKKFVRLFATDIVLLGSFNDCNLNGLPKAYKNLPITTSNIPPLSPVVQGTDTTSDTEGTSLEKGTVKITGMDWEHDPTRRNPYYGKGLFFGVDCTETTTLAKSCINLERISELGVSNDISYTDWLSDSTKLTSTEVISDGLITRTEIDDEETRAMFATMNNNGLHKLKFDKSTGYKYYDIKYMYPTNFDGREEKIAAKYTNGSKTKTIDIRDSEYEYFRFGSSRNIYYDYKEKGTDSDFPLYNNSFFFYFGLNPGKTAIEKMRSMFDSECFQNVKYPFSMIIRKESAASCIYKQDSKGIIDIEKCGIINIDLPDIKTPYSYVLENVDTNETFSEGGLTMKNLIFGVERDGNTYIEPTESDVKYSYSNKDYKKIGIIEPNVEKGETYLLNANYRITVTDANGKSITDTVTLAQPPISLNYTTSDLGTKFIPKTGDAEYTEPDYIYNNDLYGSVVISNVFIDGGEYKIETVTKVNNSEYELSVIGKNGDKYNVNMKITIENFNTDLDTRMDDWYKEGLPSVCTDDKIIFDSASGTILYKIWVPVTLNFVITQYCNGELNNNFSTNIATINDGQLFNAFINDVPLALLNTSIENKDVMNAWLNANDPSNKLLYNYPSVANNKAVWGEYIKYDEDEDGKPTVDTLYNAILYKLGNVFSLSNASYFVNDNNSFILTTEGGGSQIIKQGAYPSYDNVKSDGTIDKWDLDLYSQSTCDDYHPNFVSTDYYVKYSWYKKSEKQPYTPFVGGQPRYIENPLISPSNYFLYFAAFTNNGGIGDMSGMSYQKQPNINGNAPITINGKLEESVNKSFDTVLGVNKSKLDKWFKASFIDKRLGYDIEIINTGKIKMDVFGGIKMSYDEDYNIIGDKLEYSYNENNGSISLNDNTKSLYKCSSEYYNVNSGGNIDFIKDATISGNTFIYNDNTKPFKTISFDISSCSYDISPVIEDENNETVIKAYTKEGENVNFELDTSNFIKLTTSNIDNAISNDDFNALCNSKIEGNKLTLDPRGSRLLFTFTEDDYANGFIQTSFKPLLLTSTTESGLETLVKNLTDNPDRYYITENPLYNMNICMNDGSDVKEYAVLGDNGKNFYNPQEPYNILNIEEFSKLYAYSKKSYARQYFSYSASKIWDSSNVAYGKYELNITIKHCKCKTFGGREYVNSNYSNEYVKKHITTYGFGDEYSFDNLVLTLSTSTTTNNNIAVNIKGDITNGGAKYVSSDYTPIEEGFSYSFSNNSLDITIPSNEPNGYIKLFVSNQQDLVYAATLKVINGKLEGDTNLII